MTKHHGPFVLAITTLFGGNALQNEDGQPIVYATEASAYAALEELLENVEYAESMGYMPEGSAEDYRRESRILPVIFYDKDADK